MEVEVRFLGKPEVRIDGVPVELKQKKTQALLLYVLFNGTCTRDELAELLWCDYPEESARRNLRNSLYKLKAELKEEILLVKGHSFVRVSPEVTLKKDIDLFVTENSVDQMLALSSCVFLEHVYLKNCPEFENWIVSIRSVYEKMLVKRFAKELERSQANQAGHRVELCAQKILEIDPYQEQACRALMRVYMTRRDYNQATACYYQLQGRLEKELDVQPEAETQELFRELLNQKKTLQTVDYAGRERSNVLVVETLRQEFLNFKSGRLFCHCILSGDIGMGKSESLQEFLSGVGRGKCLQVEFQLSNRNVDYYGAERVCELLTAWSGFRPGRSASPRIAAGALDYVRLFEALFAHMDHNGNKVVLVLQNLEALDSRSLALFQTCLFESPPPSIFLVGEYCPNFEEDSRFLNRLNVLPHFKQIYFPRLDEPGSMRYLQQQLGPDWDLDELAREGYGYTGGNLLLLREFTRNLQEGAAKPYALSQDGIRMVDKLLSSLTPDEYRQLELLAVLGSAEVETLTDIMHVPSISVVQVLDTLFRRGWICEQEENDHLLLTGRFGMIQSRIYERMPRYKKLELHRLVAEHYERRYQQRPKDLFFLTRVCRHYDQTRDSQKRIYYDVLHLECVLDYFDEFFPTVIDDDQRRQSLLLSRKEIYDRFEKYNAALLKLEDEMPPQQYYELRMKLDFLQGRTMLRSGQREESRHYIQEMIRMARQLGRNDMLIKGYVETLCYAVRSENAQLMEQYIHLAQEIEKFESYEKEKGVLLRLQGYLAILQGRHQQAEEYLWASIEVFEHPKLRSSNYSNIAGAYAYLALNSRHQMKLDEAMEYIQKAITLCKEKNVQKSLDLFYEDCGYILFLKKDYPEAERYFLMSIDLYERMDNFWLRSISESCLAMIYARQGKQELSLEHFRQAEVYSRKEMAREELLVLAQARKLMKEYRIL